MQRDDMYFMIMEKIRFKRMSTRSVGTLAFGSDAQLPFS
jgi:hypothetical protein